MSTRSPPGSWPAGSVGTAGSWSYRRWRGVGDGRDGGGGGVAGVPQERQAVGGLDRAQQRVVGVGGGVPTSWDQRAGHDRWDPAAVAQAAAAGAHVVAGGLVG